MWPFRPVEPRMLREPVARVEPKVPALRINEEARALARRKRAAPPMQAFTIPKPLPGVVPTGAQDMAMDYAGLYDYAQEGLFGEGLGFLGYPYLAELAQRSEYRRFSEIIAKEMTRKWIKLTAVGDEDKTERLAGINAGFDKFKVRDVFRAAAEKDGYFGRCHVYLDTGLPADSELRATPLLMQPETVKKGSLKALRLIEPMWCYPADYNSTDPLHEDFYRPRTWYVNAIKVHRSRLLTLVGREMPDLLKPAYMFGGLSLSQMAKPTVDNWLRVRPAVTKLIETFSVSGIKTNMAAVLSGGDATNLFARADMYNDSRDNSGLMLIDKATEDFFNVATPLGTLDHLQAQAQEHMASVVGIPLVKLLGITPSGLNASSDGEIRVFYDWIAAQQEHLFSPSLDVLLKLIQLNEFGDIDPEIGYSYEPLWQATEAEKSVIRKTNADAASVMIADGVLAPEEERRRLAAEEGGLYNGLDPNDAPDLSDEEAAGLEPQDLAEAA